MILDSRSMRVHTNTYDLVRPNAVAYDSYKEYFPHFSYPTFILSNLGTTVIYRKVYIL
jgi:hypothetical protein